MHACRHPQPTHAHACHHVPCACHAYRRRHVARLAYRGVLSDGAGRSPLQVVSLDWAQLDPATAGSFDVVLGSDLVYDDGAVDLLIGVVDHLLSPSGVFYLAAGGKRKGVAKLLADLPGRGFGVSSMDAPAAYLSNPLSSADENELELHFNELGENTFTLHAITRRVVAD